ncbi:MAG: ComF family protein [Tepidanaerobacteraceae bacterium]|nr:ComF family protein [Tepidanaerobacteraceae bacterium]
MSENQNLTKLFLNLVFPPKPYCLICSNKLTGVESIICNVCKNEISPLSDPLCKKCGKPLEINTYIGVSHNGDHLCYDCQREQHPFIQARSYGRYEGILKQIIYEYKYHGKRELAEFLGSKMFHLLKQLPWPSSDYLVPLPLHIKRQRERGFNQAFLLAKVIARESCIPIFKGLVRIKPTEHQTLLDKTLRKRNLKGAFKVNQSHKIYKKTIILVDDVYTTGTTVAESSKTLLEAGAKAVYILTCARG